MAPQVFRDICNKTIGSSLESSYRKLFTTSQFAAESGNIPLIDTRLQNIALAATDIRIFVLSVAAIMNLQLWKMRELRRNLASSQVDVRPPN